MPTKRTLLIAVLCCVQLALPFIWLRRPSPKACKSNCEETKAPIVAMASFCRQEDKGQEDRRPRVAVCFYGLNRSMRYTIDSIRNHVLIPLAKACAHVDLYFHTWTLAALKDRHNGEAGVPLGGPKEELELLHSAGYPVKRYIVEDQDLFDATAANLSAYTAIDGRYAGPNMKNLVRQLESLRRVTQLWQLDKTDFILYLRPDLRLLDDLNVTTLFRLGATQFITPYWGQYTGLNDRLSAARPRAAAHFGNRLDLSWHYASNIKFLRSESFLEWVMLTHHHLRPVFTDLRGQRIRATGLIAPNDFCLQFCQYPRHRIACRGDCRSIIPPGVETPPRPDWAIRQQEWDLQHKRVSPARVRKQLRKGLGVV